MEMLASPIQRRLCKNAADIASSPPADLLFTHSVLTQVYLPMSRPPKGMVTWERQQGHATLRVEAGSIFNPETGRFEQQPLPYGPKARLILIHLSSEAVQRQSSIIPVEESMTAFFRRVMGQLVDGRQLKMLKSQLAPLTAATFRLGIRKTDEQALQINTKLVSAFELWRPWPSILQLSQDYFDSLVQHAVPLDERAIAALAHTALGLDIYCWLAHRLHRIPAGKPQFVPWAAIHNQFGQGYREIRKFRRDFLMLLSEVREVYPEAQLSYDLHHGLKLKTSSPPVSKRLVLVTHSIRNRS